MKVGRSSEICNGLCYLWSFLVFYLFAEFIFKSVQMSATDSPISEFLSMVKSGFLGIIIFPNSVDTLFTFLNI